MNERLDFGNEDDEAGEGGDLERAEALKEKGKHVKELLYPTGDRDDLSDILLKGIYRGKTQLEVREQNTIEFGFDPEKLEKEGTLIFEETERLIEKSQKGELTEEEQQRLRRFHGFTHSREGKGKDQKIMRHSAITIGLMFETSQTFRRWLKASLEIDAAKAEQILFSDVDVQVSDEEIKRFVSLRNSGEDEFKLVRKRQVWLLSGEKAREKREKYRSEFMSWLNIEAAIQKES